MADEKHLKILKQGGEAWRKWRDEHPDVLPNLQDADLPGSNLQYTDLRDANLRHADLWNANLQRVNLQGANLKRTNLVGAQLQRANLRNAQLQGADLQDADLQRADLRDAKLQDAKLQDAKLQHAQLQGADLRGAKLQRASFLHTDLSNAIFTGARLYGGSRDDWIIDGIQCDFVYWDAEGKERTPKDRDFHPGEFEELYKSLPSFEYYFEQGFTPLDPLIMDRVVQAINGRYPEIELKLDSFHSRGNSHAVFTVLHKESVEIAQQQVKDDYECRIAALESKQEEFMQMLSMIGSGNIMLQTIGDGFTLKRAISTELTQQIVAFLVSLPGVDFEDARRGWMFNAGLDARLYRQIQFRGSSLHFVQLLVQTVINYGTLDTGKHAFEAILEAAREFIGKEKQAWCDELLGALQQSLKETAQNSRT